MDIGKMVSQHADSLSPLAYTKNVTKKRGVLIEQAVGFDQGSNDGRSKRDLPQKQKDEDAQAQLPKNANSENESTGQSVNVLA